MPSGSPLARHSLDRQLEAVRRLVGVRPSLGWVRAIRDAIGMSGAELASRMGLSQSRVSALEAAERDGRTTLRSLEAAAEALDCDLLYALVPRESLDAMVRRQAAVKAREEVAAVVASMQLENQQAPADVTQAQVHELADRLVDRRGLWS